MRLNDAEIMKFTLNQVDYKNNIKGFLNTLLNSERCSAELVIDNQHIIPAGSVKFTVNSGWVYANVSTKLSFGETLRCNNLKVSVFCSTDKENPIMESNTEVLYTINENDVEARLCFMVGSVFPYNGLKLVVPESRFVSLGTSNFPVKALNEYDQMANVEIVDPDPGTEQEPDPGSDPVPDEEPEPGTDPEQADSTEPDPGDDPESGAGTGEDTGD